jgi:predicted naringenin-chalcone synthase
MAVVCEPRTVRPAYEVHQAELIEAIGTRYPDPPRLSTGVRMMEHTSVRTRYFVTPPEEALVHEGVAGRSRRFAREGRRLAAAAAWEALDAAGVGVDDVEILIVTSCTGFPMPGLDAMLCNDTGMRPSVRLPVSQLGCAGGAAAMAFAHDLCRSRPGSHALIVTVELASLCFQPDDLFGPAAVSSFVSAGLFGDGAAAVVVRGDGDGTGLETIAARIELLPDSEGHIAYRHDERGIHFDTNPAMLTALPHMAPAMHRFLADEGVTAEDLDFLICHTGGPRILDGVVEGLGVDEDYVAASRESLARVGNLSSVTVLDVLERTIADRRPLAGDLGLVIGIGPGVTTALVLVRWRETTPAAALA